MAKFRYPALTFLLGDAFWTLAGAQSTLEDGVVPRVAYANAWPSICFNPCPSKYVETPDQLEKRTRHLQGSIIGFADGHVKWFRSRNITIGCPSQADRVRLLVLTDLERLSSLDGSVREGAKAALAPCALAPFICHVGEAATC